MTPILGIKKQQKEREREREKHGKKESLSLPREGGSPRLLSWLLVLLD